MGLCRIVIVRTLLVALLALHSVAFADELTSAREHYRKATKAFELGLFDEAIREYTEAYRIKDDPAILYNLGQAHRLAQHPAEALHFYKMYLSKQPDAPNRAEVESKIDTLQKLVEQQQKAQNLSPNLPRPMETAAPPPAARVEGAPPPKRREPLPPGRLKEISGIVVGAVGVGLLGAGIAFGVLAKNAGDDLTRTANAGMFDYNKQQDGKRDQVLEAVFLSIGGAAVATGAVLYVLGRRDAQLARRRNFSFAPTMTSRFIGVTAQARF
jgi:tetratricopeptide (TPR) repeat protein